jgi:collagen type VI alpha
MGMERVGTMLNLLFIGTMISGAAAEDLAITDTTDSCPPVPHDVVYVVDTSLSITKIQFQLMRNALASMAKSFNIGSEPHDTRLAMVGFGRVSERYFDFRFGTNETSVIERIQNMNRVHDSHGTRTHLGIQKMIETFEGDYGSRSDAQHLSIVLTDGNSSKRKSLATSLKVLATKNITQYAVGIGRKIKQEDLKQIALGNYNHVILAEDFDALGGIASDLVKHVSCSEFHTSVS